MKNVHEVEIKLEKEWVDSLDAVFKKKNKERCISYDAYSHNEIDHMNIFGSEDYELVAFDNT